MPNHLMDAWVTSFINDVQDPRPVHTALIAVIAHRWQVIGCPEIMTITSVDLSKQGCIHSRNLKKELEVLQTSKILSILQYSRNQYANYEFQISGKIISAMSKTDKALSLNEEKDQNLHVALSKIDIANDPNQDPDKSAMSKTDKALLQNTGNLHVAMSENDKALGPEDCHNGGAMSKTDKAHGNNGSAENANDQKTNDVTKKTRTQRVFSDYIYYKYNNIIDKIHIYTETDEMGLYVSLFTEITGRPGRSSDALRKALRKIFSSGDYFLKDVEKALLNFVKDDYSKTHLLNALTVFYMLSAERLEKYCNIGAVPDKNSRQISMFQPANPDMSIEKQEELYGKLTSVPEPETPENHEHKTT